MGVTKYYVYVLVILLSCRSFIEETAGNSGEHWKYTPRGPLLQCEFLPLRFLECDDPQDFKGNQTQRDVVGYGCYKYGNYKYEEVDRTKVMCKVLAGVVCDGNSTFWREGVPCVKYGGYYFLTTLLYSILLGFLGMDRFSLGLTGTAVGKLLTLGGFGIWWIVDVILLVTNGLLPEDGSNWETTK